MIFYVRPSGGSYGSENGTSYENAWNGFTNIDWTITGVKPGDTLYICGTHKEVLTVGGSGTLGSEITIRGDYPGDAGVIDSENTRNTGISINSKNFITLTSLSSIDAVVDCLKIWVTSVYIITNDCTFTGSGNQGIQHTGTVLATHNNPTCSNNTDDGISGHDYSIIIINGGTFSNNADGINIVDDVHCTISGALIFSGNTYDVWAATATTEESCCIDITGATLPTSARATVGGKIILTNCIVSGTLEIADIGGTGYCEANGCIFSGASHFGVDSHSIVTDSAFINTIACGDVTATIVLIRCLVTSWAGNVHSEITFSGCYVKANNVYNTVLIAEYTLFEGGDDHICDVDNGCAATFKYCIFKGMASGKFGIGIRAGCTATIDGCTFVSDGNVGKGVFTLVDVTINNSIFNDLATGIHQSGGDVVANNCVFYNCNDNTVNVVVENDSQYGDPKLIDVSNNNFRPDTLSSAIRNGLDLGVSFDDGIDTATWGNGINEAPSVTTKQQAAVYWDIGAYIHLEGDARKITGTVEVIEVTGSIN